MIETEQYVRFIDEYINRRARAMRKSYIANSLLAIALLLEPRAAIGRFAVKDNSQLAGCYRCSAVNGTLHISDLPNNDLAFDLDSMWVGDVTMGNVNTGSAHGKLKVKGDTAIFTDAQGPYTLTFTFKRNAVDIEYDGTGFGQWKVTPAGHYKKVKLLE